MSKVGETVQHVNTSLRTLIAGGALIFVAVASYQGYRIFSQPRQELKQTQADLQTLQVKYSDLNRALDDKTREATQLGTQVTELTTKNTELASERDRLATSLRLLRLRHRLARVTVREQAEDADGKLQTKFDFTEINDEGQPIGETRSLDIAGDRIYIEYLVVKFEDKYVEQADLERGTTICLIERVFGENQEPSAGYVIDRVGSRPTGYDRGLPVSDFEQKIWQDFWSIANSRERAAELGIRAAHAEAPSLRVEKGKAYEIDIRSSGDFSFRPVE